MKINYLYYILIMALAGLGACASADSSLAPASNGKGGSMARFAIEGDHLYTLDTYQLKVFDIKNPQNPNFASALSLNNDIETIFPYQNHIFIGTQTGMIILDNANPALPEYLSTYAHIRSCDPVVVQGKYAYVTLRAGNFCGRGENVLEVIDISNLQNPSLVKSYPMTSPYGLGIDGNQLFVCDGSAGLKFFNATDPLNLVQTKQISNLNTYDVIPWQNRLLLIGADGLFQYSYAGDLISSIPVVKN
jgi:hypothetical protein